MVAYVKLSRYIRKIDSRKMISWGELHMNSEVDQTDPEEELAETSSMEGTYAIDFDNE